MANVHKGINLTVWVSVVGILLAGCSTGQEQADPSLNQNTESTQESPPSESEIPAAIENESEIPAAIENFGFELDSFDPATGFAGDLQISGVTPPVAPENDPNRESLDISYKYLMSRYGEDLMGRRDPQMAFFLPLGSKVRSMISGTVCDVTTLYSNDLSIRIAPPGVSCFPEGQGGANVLFEHEHVIGATVKYGDFVNAGQVIAEVSDYRSDWKAQGFGIVEIGVFFSKKDSPDPWHGCPMKFISPDKKQELLGDLNSAYVAWESELGDSTLYDELAEFPGCVTTEDISG